MAKTTTPKHAATPPKGRPTPARNDRTGTRRAFGATAQWIAVTFALLLVFVIMFILLDGGDFNPFNDGAAQGTPAQGRLVPLGSGSLAFVG